MYSMYRYYSVSDETANMFMRLSLAAQGGTYHHHLHHHELGHTGTAEYMETGCLALLTLILLWIAMPQQRSLARRVAGM